MRRLLPLVALLTLLALYGAERAYSAPTVTDGLYIDRTLPLANARGETGLQILGTVSGTNLFAVKSITGTDLYGVRIAGGGLSSCSNSVTSKLLWNAATKQFSCGTDQAGGSQFSNTGSLRTYFDTRYVSKQGDTVTGALVINVQGGNVASIGLKALNTISGAIIHAEKGLTSSGAVVAKSVSGTSLEIIGTASGGDIFATRSVTGSYLYAAVTFGGAGLTSCSNATTSKLLYNSATKQFSCGTDTDTNTTYTTGQGLTLTATSFRLSATISGSIIKVSSTLADSGALVVDGLSYFKSTVSGAYLHAEKGLSTSGSLVVAKGITGATLEILGTGSGKNLYATQAMTGTNLYAVTTFGGAGLADCSTVGTSKLLWSVATKQFSCGTDQNSAGTPEIGTGSFSGATLRLGDARYVKKAGDTMTGTLTVSLTAGNIGLKVLAGMSGNTLTVGRGANFAGSGVLITNTGTVVFNEQSRNVDFRIESDGNVNAFYVDASADRIGLFKNNPKAALDVIGTVSGSTLHAADLNAVGGIVYVNASKDLSAMANGTSGRIITSQGNNPPIYQPVPRSISWGAIDSTTPVATGTGVGMVSEVGFPCMLRQGNPKPVIISVKRAPEGKPIIVDVMRNGVSIFSTKPKIEPNRKTNTGGVIGGGPTSSGGVVWSMNINQVGNTVSGSGLTVIVPCDSSPI